MKQMSLFDYMPELKSLDELTIEDLVQIFESSFPIKFKYNSHLEQYEYKKGKAVISIDLRNYSFGEYKRFISTDLDWNLGGCGIPCDSIEEAKDNIARFIERINEINSKKKAS